MCVRTGVFVRVCSYECVRMGVCVNLSVCQYALWDQGMEGGLAADSMQEGCGKGRRRNRGDVLEIIIELDDAVGEKYFVVINTLRCNSALSILADPSFEEVGSSVERDKMHEVERIRLVVQNRHA